MDDAQLYYEEALITSINLSDAELLRIWANAEMLLEMLPHAVRAFKTEAARRRLTPNKNDAAH